MRYAFHLKVPDFCSRVLKFRIFSAGMCVFSSILLLGSCAVGPNFKAPAPPPVARYTHEVIKSHHSEQVLTTQWWSVFQSPDLNQLIETAMHQNNALISINERIKSARQKVIASQGLYYPQVSNLAMPGKQKYGAAFTGGAIEIPSYNYYQFGPTATLALDLFGQIKRTVELQQALYEYQQQLRNASLLTLTANITQSALSIAILNSKIKYMKQMIHCEEKSLVILQNAFKIGSATQLMVLNAKRQYTSSRASLPNMLQQKSVEEAKLNLLVGRFPADWEPPQFYLEHMTLPQQIHLRVPSQLVRVRPDIVAAETLLHASSANIGIATANLYPQITLTAAGSTQANVFSQLFNTSAFAGNIFAGIVSPIFNGGALKAERRSAIYAYKAACAHYKEVVIRAFIDVNDRLHELEHDRETLRQKSKLLLVAKHALKLTRISYAAGNTNKIHLLNAERLYDQAMLAYAEAKGLCYLDTAELMIALGGSGDVHRLNTQGLVRNNAKN